MKGSIANCVLCAAALLAMSGCATRTVVVPDIKTVYKEVVVEKAATPPPGTVQYVWEEPMIDVVDIPPGLDPEGVYYRPAHQEVLEIRQGRWKHYRGPE